MKNEASFAMLSLLMIRPVVDVPISIPTLNIDVSISNTPVFFRGQHARRAGEFLFCRRRALQTASEAGVARNISTKKRDSHSKLR